MPIKIVDERRYPINPQNTNDILSYWRFEHRATLQYNGREFWVLADNGIIFDGKYLEPPKLYIEEMFINGKLDVIKEDELHAELAAYAQEHGFCEMIPALPKNASNRVL